MQNREWHFDKKSYKPGPWDDEPDKLQFMTMAGLPGLIIRGPMGALCGYVGVQKEHPLYGVHYNKEMDILASLLEKRLNEPMGENPSFNVLISAVLGCEVEKSPEAVFTVHGGLTFSSHCSKPTRERWEQWRKSMIDRKDEAVMYPSGDIARAWIDRGDQVEDYEAYAKWTELRAICHVPEPHESDDVWYFGFDCSHCDDLIPMMLEYGFNSMRNSIYRDVEYVRKEVESLAAQLVDVA